ncbi:50S ribosomal protein L7/L12 [bacterium]|nr:50S ribosomal protein L7/L12 [bacterium]
MEEEVKKEEEIKEEVSEEKEKEEEKKEEVAPEEKKPEEKKEEVSKEEPKEEQKEQEKEEKPEEEKKEEIKEEAKEEKKEEANEAPKEEKSVEVPEKFKKIVEEIEKMSVLDLAELVKILEKKFGVTTQAPVMAAPTAPGVPSGAPGAAPAEGKSTFNIVLTEVGDRKIEVIKAVRDITQKGLKESKDLVDAVSASGPQVIKENVKKEEAEEIKKKFETAGAKVELK